jgi:ribosomal protein L3 glutamine methyltransferase
VKFDTESLTSIKDFVRWGASRFGEAGLFFGHGTDNALDEAVQLVLCALHLPPDLPPVYLESRLTPNERDMVVSLIRRRIEGRVPVAYLTNKAWFAGLEFYVNDQVLVPRSPFAELIENQLRPWIDPDAVHRVLDLCTGSGCIGIATAVHLSKADVDLVDISESALDVARRNLVYYGLETRVRAIRSDLFDALGGRRYDVILSNPPYVSAEELAGLPPEYQCEPSLGLAGGDDGLDLVRRILRQAANHLEPAGVMIVEVGNSAVTLTQAYPELPFLWLELERGGEGVFLLTAEQLKEFSNQCEQEVTETP